MSAEVSILFCEQKSKSCRITGETSTGVLLTQYPLGDELGAGVVPSEANHWLVRKYTWTNNRQRHFRNGTGSPRTFNVPTLLSYPCRAVCGRVTAFSWTESWSLQLHGFEVALFIISTILENWRAYGFAYISVLVLQDLHGTQFPVPGQPNIIDLSDWTRSSNNVCVIRFDPHSLPCALHTLSCATLRARTSSSSPLSAVRIMLHGCMPKLLSMRKNWFRRETRYHCQMQQFLKETVNDIIVVYQRCFNYC